MKTMGKGGLQNASLALRYVLNHDIDVAIVGMHKLSELEQNVAIANNLQPLSFEEKKQLQEIVEKIIKTGALSNSGAVLTTSGFV